MLGNVSGKYEGRDLGGLYQIVGTNLKVMERRISLDHSRYPEEVALKGMGSEREERLHSV